jgi:hypothetical protein
VLLTERGSQAQDRRRFAAGEGRSPAKGGKSPETESRRGQGRKLSQASGSGREGFLKTEYGRTGQSTVPVRCTPDNAQEKRSSSARQPVHRTLHSAVSGAHRTIR